MSSSPGTRPARWPGGARPAHVNGGYRPRGRRPSRPDEPGCPASSRWPPRRRWRRAPPSSCTRRRRSRSPLWSCQAPATSGWSSARRVGSRPTRCRPSRRPVPGPYGSARTSCVPPPPGRPRSPCSAPGWHAGSAAAGGPGIASLARSSRMLGVDVSPRRAQPPAEDGGPEDWLGDTVEHAQKGDEDAFRAVYRSVQPGLLRYLRGLVGDDAEDVASEAWSQIARDLPGFHGDGSGFRAWAVTIARNRALDYLRHQRRRPQPAGIAATELVDRPSEEDTAGAALDRVSTDDAIALIAALPRDQAEAVLLRTVMGLDVATAAKILGKRP